MARSVFGTRGSRDVKFDGGTISLWYNFDARMWVVQTLDAEGNQTGPNRDGTAYYVHARPDAVDEAERALTDALIDYGTLEDAPTALGRPLTDDEEKRFIAREAERLGGEG